MLHNGFDIENLKPTYQLLIGVPGKSNAFAISKKLGISPSIIEKASNLINSDNMQIEELLKNIYDDKILIENEKLEIEKQLKQINNLKTILEKEYSNINSKKEEVLNKAKEESRNILTQAKEEASRMIKEMNDSYNNYDSSSIKKLNKIRNELNQSIKETSSTNSNITQSTHFKLEDLQVGTIVSILNMSQYGTITSITNNKENKIQVEVGNIKLVIPISSVTGIISSQNEKLSGSVSSYKANSKSKTATTEINVIGCTLEEAIFLIDKYLDDCALAKLKTVRIVHGKGTGTLRKGIHSFLKNHPHVSSFRLGTFGEGETGVTIVELLF